MNAQEHAHIVAELGDDRELAMRILEVLVSTGGINDHEIAAVVGEHAMHVERVMCKMRRLGLVSHAMA